MGDASRLKLAVEVIETEEFPSLTAKGGAEAGEVQALAVLAWFF